MEKYLYELIFSHENVSENAYKLFDIGITGVQEVSDNLIKIFSSNLDEVDELIKNVLDLGFTFVNKEEIVNENWIIKCPSELESLEVGNLKVIPVIEKENHEILNIENVETNIIPVKIIPGMAFGTGHHETTKNVLKLLEHDEIKNNVSKGYIKNALDVGTGSAILAIAANLLYNIPVVAFDNDELAIENAKDNVKINNLSDKISLFCGEIKDINQKFDIILANIYAEILVDIYENILNASTQNTFLLLSGIQEVKFERVLSKYSLNFEVIDEIIENNWCSILLKIK